MKYTYACKKVSLNDSIKEYAEKKISKLERYFREEDLSLIHIFLSAWEASFDRDGCREVTVEAGRPDTITADKLAVLQSHGVTRISVNPQTMEDHVLRAIGRRHTAAAIDEAMELVGRYHFPHVNMDLIAGLPADSPEGFCRSLDRCLDYGPDNVTVHTLALKKEMCIRDRNRGDVS